MVVGVAVACAGMSKESGLIAGPLAAAFVYHARAHGARRGGTTTVAALIGIAEPVLGPIWVWLVHGEVPGVLTLVGGSIVFGALLLHLLWEYRQQRQQVAVPLAD